MSTTIYPDDFKRMSEIYGNSKDSWNSAFYYPVCRECREDPPCIIEDYKTGDTICGTCGLVLDQGMVDTGAEWRTFEDDKNSNNPDPSRVGDGASTSLLGAQLTTRVADDGSGRQNVKDLQRAHHKSSLATAEDKINKQLSAAYIDLASFAAAANLSQLLCETAKKLTMTCMLRDRIRRQPTKPEFAAIIFRAAKQVGQARDVKECLNIVHLDPKAGRKSFNAAYKRIDEAIRDSSLHGEKKLRPKDAKDARQELEQQQNMLHDRASANEEHPSIMGARALLPRFCERLKMKHWKRSLAEALAAAIEDAQALDSRGPSNVAATTLYILTALLREPITLEQAANLADLSANTIRKALILATERKASIIASPKFPEDARISLRHWPDIVFNSTKALLPPQEQKPTPVSVSAESAPTPAEKTTSHQPEMSNNAPTKAVPSVSNAPSTSNTITSIPESPSSIESAPLKSGHKRKMSSEVVPVSLPPNKRRMCSSANPDQPQTCAA